MAEKMKTEIASMLQGIERWVLNTLILNFYKTEKLTLTGTDFLCRYNPDNLQKLEKYVELQALENMYDLEANLSVLRLYQFGPNLYRSNIVNLILLKALTNLPHTDFVLCKCLLTQDRVFHSPNLNHLWVLVVTLCFVVVGRVSSSQSDGSCWFTWNL